MKGSEDMPVLESEKAKKDSVLSGQPADGTAISDIENALNFLDSEEYQEASQPIPHTKNKLNKQGDGEPHRDAAKPFPSELDPVIFPTKVIYPRQEDSATKTTPGGKAPSRMEKKPTKGASVPLIEPRSEKSGKIWLLLLGTAVLIFLAILLLHEMGYLFAGP